MLRQRRDSKTGKGGYFNCRRRLLHIYHSRKLCFQRVFVPPVHAQVFVTFVQKRYGIDCRKQRSVAKRNVVFLALVVFIRQLIEINGAGGRGMTAGSDIHR